MGKRVIVVASGETERRALPHLLADMNRQGVTLDEVRIPPGNRSLSPKVCESIIKATWYERLNTPSVPDKFVIVLDSDKRNPQDVIGEVRDNLVGRLTQVKATIQYAFACQHLEAWYFGDAINLRKFLGRALGNIDESKPDDIENPKRHLKNLLGRRVYTAQLSEEIAQALDTKVMSDRSPSFRGFREALANGEPK